MYSSVYVLNVSYENAYIQAHCCGKVTNKLANWVNSTVMNPLVARG